MGVVKRLTRDDRVRSLLCWIASLYIRLVWRTTRWEVVAGDIPARYWDAGLPFVCAFWHGRLLLMSYCWRAGKPVHMLISQHPDGQFIAKTIAHLGIGTIAGSSTRGGSSALRAMIRALKHGQWIGITPDGPRGPRQRVQGSIIDLARLAGVPIIPATYAVKHRLVLGSWDRFVVALPFSKGVFVWGRPIEVPRDLSEAGQEALREELEERLNALTAAADMRVGRKPIDPAPLPAEHEHAGA